MGGHRVIEKCLKNFYGTGHFAERHFATFCLYFTIKVSVIKIDNDFSHRNFDRVSEPLKFRRYLYFRQVVRSSNCPFGKMSVRQSAVRSAKCPFGKASVRQNVRRQNVRSAKCLSAKCPATISTVYINKENFSKWFLYLHAIGQRSIIARLSYNTATDTGQYFSCDGSVLVVNYESLHCCREREITWVSCSVTATQSFAQSLPKF